MGDHKFKIGDKVKLKPDYVRRFPMGVGIGIVTGIDNVYIMVTSKSKYCKGDGFPQLPDEIELLVKVGEQLEFLFMKDIIGG